MLTVIFIICKLKSRFTY